MRLHGLSFIQSLPILLNLYFVRLGSASTPPVLKANLAQPSPPERSLPLAARAIPTPWGPPPAGSSYSFDEEWIIDCHFFNTLLPLETAASKLQAFYEGVAVAAFTTQLAPSDRYLIRLGTIDLEIRSQMGDIPWTYVIGFANAMRELTRMGLTNTYQINYIHRATGRFVTMSLWIGVVRWG